MPLKARLSRQFAEGRLMEAAEKQLTALADEGELGENRQDLAHDLHAAVDATEGPLTVANILDTYREMLTETLDEFEVGSSGRGAFSARSIPEVDNPGLRYKLWALQGAHNMKPRRLGDLLTIAGDYVAGHVERWDERWDTLLPVATQADAFLVQNPQADRLAKFAQQVRPEYERLQDYDPHHDAIIAIRENGREEDLYLCFMDVRLEKCGTGRSSTCRISLETSPKKP